MHIWLSKDRYRRDEAGAADRVFLSTVPIGIAPHATAPQAVAVVAADLPAGPRGQAWEVRELDVPDSLVAAVLRASISPASQDRIHRAWWSKAGGGAPWPQ